MTTDSDTNLVTENFQFFGLKNNKSNFDKMC